MTDHLDLAESILGSASNDLANVVTTDDARRALSGWCACRQHSGCQSRPHVAHRCGCTCHGKDQQ